MAQIPHSQCTGPRFDSWSGNKGASQEVLVVKNPPADAGDIRDTGSIPRSGNPLKESMAAHSRILAWRVPWTEEPGGLQSTGLQRVGHD